MTKWNDDWRDEGHEKYPALMERLAECRNLKRDIPVMARLMYKYNKDMGAEECFIRTLEWIGDWNNQYTITDLTRDEYDCMLHDVMKEE